LPDTLRSKADRVTADWGCFCVDLLGLREVLDVVSHKWDLIILAHLRERPLRYSELAQQIRQTSSDLTEGVLSKNLKRLNANGLIHRESVGNDQHVWALTPRGRHVVAGLAKIAAFQSAEEPPASDGAPHTAAGDADSSNGHDGRTSCTDTGDSAR
jgi:DNA-binding HxlR family transcriptional regulator